MNIGILTYHWVPNFGANLQTLSTYYYVLNSGHTPIIINWIPEDVEDSYKSIVLSCQNEIHQAFAKQNYKNITKICRNSEEIAQVIESNNITKVLIGSDAVFTNLPKLARYRICRRGIVHIKPKSDCDFPNPFWGDFKRYLKNPVDIIAISASAQNMPYKKIWFSKEKKDYKNALLGFKRITVRDVWTQNMIKYVSSGNVIPPITPDPVFAFEQNVKPKKLDYVHSKLGFVNRYVLFSGWSSIKDDNWIIELEDLFRKEGVFVVGLPRTTMKTFCSPLKYNLEFPISPLEWYDAIKYSDGYIGELMHPVLVSLHNSVPVFSFDTYGFSHFLRLDVKSSKIYQILKRFDLLDNYYNRKFNQSLPTPIYVFEKIKSFDRNKCEIESRSMFGEYDAMMKQAY